MQLYVVTIWSKCWSESEVYENLSYLFISANCKECHIKKKKYCLPQSSPPGFPDCTFLLSQPSKVKAETEVRDNQWAVPIFTGNMLAAHFYFIFKVGSECIGAREQWLQSGF